jgi:Fur family peroxide stress response transcriptional regulator
MQKKISADCREHFLDRCKKYRLKITPQRCAIYDELVGSKNHPTAEQMYEMVKKEFPNVSYDTVNRTLLTFAKIGLVEIVQSKGAPRRFDAILENHHHFSCVRCGKIIDLDLEEYDRLKIPDHIRNEFTVFVKRVVLTGLCRDCRGHEKESGISK